MQTIAPLRIGQNVKEVLEADLAGELDAFASYKASREICEAEVDYVTKNLFEQLLQDEESHVDFLETELDLLERLGQQNYELLQAKGADEAE